MLDDVAALSETDAEDELLGGFDEQAESLDLDLIEED